STCSTARCAPRSSPRTSAGRCGSTATACSTPRPVPTPRWCRLAATAVAARATPPRADQRRRHVPYANVRDLVVYHEVHGAGPRVLYINGTGAALRRDPTRASAPLTQHFKVLMYDQRGLGDTSKPDVD